MFVTTQPQNTKNFRYLQNMPAVRLRGQDAIDRALEAQQLHLNDMMSVEEIADHYDATPRAVYDWLKLARKHTLPDLDDKLGWLQLIINDQGARLEDAKDGDSTRIAMFLTQTLGVGSMEELRAQAVRIEAAKVAVFATAFDQAIAGLPNRNQLREKFMEAIDANGATV